MKIKADKKEFADLVRTCTKDCSCASCVLFEFCGKDGMEIEDLIEIAEPPKEYNGFNIRGE